MVMTSNILINTVGFIIMSIGKMNGNFSCRAVELF